MIWPLVSVLFITYNRAHTLVATFETFLAMTDYPRDRLELILCDDASDSRNLGIARTLGFDTELVPARNGGLGANCNRGLAAAQGEYILQLQDDWIAVGPPSYLKDAIGLLSAWPDVGMVTFRPRPDLRIAESRVHDGRNVALYAPNLNAEGSIDRVSDGIYTDNPHLKRRNFHDIAGRYAENIPMTAMELEMSRAVVAQPDLHVAFIEGREAFRHIGASSSFNPGSIRHRRIEAIESLPGGRLLTSVAKRLRPIFGGRT